MHFSQITTTLLLLATTSFASPVLASRDELDNFTPGLAIPASCVKTPKGNNCPARLRSKNALLTSLNVVVKDDPTKSSHQPNNILRAGWSSVDFEDKSNAALVEESTITIFNVPAGIEKKQCRFVFTTDLGDNVIGDWFNVWSFVNGTGSADKNSTWWNKPKRDVVVAGFSTLPNDIMYTTKNSKTVHKVAVGPGFGNGKTTFPCPPKGKLAYEVAVAMKKRVGGGGAINIGGHDGLAIEIMGMKSAWDA